MLEAINIEKSFGEINIFSDINLKILPGTITVLTGASGSGKSTLMRSLSLLDYPSKGDILIDGIRYNFPSKKKFLESSIYPKITCVFQQLYLWPHLSNRTNILLPLKNRGYNVNELYRYIDLFGMKGFIDKFPNESSLGQRQRVSLVRALMLHPKYLLLDEITSALDFDNTNIILSELSNFSNEKGGILLISHDYRVVSSDKYIPILLENGRFK